MVPYTYLIGWSERNIWYYGVRYSKKCKPSDLFVSYFTSSKLVEKLRAELGPPNIIQVRKIFSCPRLARDWEIKVLRRMGAVNSNNFLNQHDKLAPPINQMFGSSNPQTRPEMREKNSLRKKKRAQQLRELNTHHVTGQPLQTTITWKCLDCPKTTEYRSYEYKHRQTSKLRCKSCAATIRNKLRWADPTYKERVGSAISKAKSHSR